MYFIEQKRHVVTWMQGAAINKTHIIVNKF